MKLSLLFTIGLVSIIAGEAMRSVPNALILGGGICVVVSLLLSVAKRGNNG